VVLCEGEIGVREAAARMGRYRQQVQALITSGLLPARRVGARRWGVAVADVDRLLATAGPWPSAATIEEAAAQGVDVATLLQRRRGRLWEVPPGKETTAEVAQRLEVTPHTVWRWVKEGKLRADRIGDVWVVDPADAAVLGKTAGGECAWCHKPVARGRLWCSGACTDKGYRRRKREREGKPGRPAPAASCRWCNGPLPAGRLLWCSNAHKWAGFRRREKERRRLAQIGGAGG
jgi:excisionase family DNA binding protein